MAGCSIFSCDIQQLVDKREKATLIVKSRDRKITHNDFSELYKLISDLCGRTHVDSIDLCNLDLVKQSEISFDKLSKSLLKFLTRPNCKQLKVSDKHFMIIQGVMKKSFIQELKQSIGEEITLLSIGVTIKVKEMSIPKCFTDKITCSNLSDDVQVTVKTLYNIDWSLNAPPLLSGVILRAFKNLRRSQKIFRRDERRLHNKVILQDHSDSESLTEKGCKTGKELHDDELSDKNVDLQLPKQETHKTNLTVQKDTPAMSNTAGKINSRQRTFKCYVCKSYYCLSKRMKRMENAWKQYPRMCLPCAELNLEKRNQKVDMSGKYAIVTGGRIKIGYEIILKLLRDGCFVIVTTRFPHDATKRLAEEKDFKEWKDRIKVYPLDLKDILGINRFVKYVQETVPHLDVIINNAAQTLRRPLDFYRHLLDYECIPTSHIKETQQSLLATEDKLSYGSQNARVQSAAKQTKCTSSKPLVEEIQDEDHEGDDEPPAKRLRSESPPSLGEGASKQSGDISQIASRNDKYFVSSNFQRSISMDSSTMQKPTGELQNDPPNTMPISNPYCSQELVRTGTNRPLFNLSQYFPRGALDDNGQQLDLRRKNSWRTVIDHVPLSELMEVLMVNAVGPFILNKELKSLMLKSPSKRRFIVNVSAMEGQFNRASKTKFHPHTNMAKAALNMLTRTAALGYKENGIYMTSVDTGWVTDERPLYMAKREKRVKGFKLPLDCVDGAARIYDPIVLGLTKTNTPYYAVFLKDYKVYPW